MLQFLTHAGLHQIENTLRWAETYFREPRINCLEGWGVTIQSADSELNKRWMRVFTTMSMVHSDGFVLYNHNSGHQHNWHEFWNTDLGKSISKKSQEYTGVDGLFIRKYTNGWAIFNRSGEPQTITLPYSRGVASDNLASTHQIPDLDGELFIRIKTIKGDVNGDSTVNILDLVHVANNFGNLEPDLNGDDTVNILDLVIVANSFGKTQEDE